MKDIKYILKRIIIGIGIALALMYIKGSLLFNVNAQVLIDNNQLSYNNYLVLQPGSSQFHFSDSTIYQDISIFPQYFLLTMCTDSNNINSWSIVYSSLINVNFYNTQISCTFPNSTYTGGHITYIYGQVNSANACSVNGTSCYQNGYINFTVPNRSSWALLSYQLSKDVINIDYGSNTIINQNQMIISGQQSIISNQNQNTTDIINNQNQNTTDIINNQNQNSQSQIDSQKVCNLVDKVDISTQDKYFTSNGTLGTSTNFGITDYIYIRESIITPLVSFSANAPPYHCYYDYNKTLISCFSNNSLVIDTPLDIPTNAYYVRFSIQKVLNRPQFNICTNGNQALQNTLTDDNVDNASNSASSFFSNFSVNSHGLSGIITAPLRLVQTFTTATCTPLTFQLPFVHDTITLPCMKPIIENYFGIFFSLYQLITTGLISYHVLINIYSKIRDLQDPNKDRIEVLNL